MDIVIDTISVEQIDTGKLAFPSRFVLMGDPCYFSRINTQDIRDFMASDASYETMHNCVLIRLSAHEEADIETVHADNRVARWFVNLAPRQLSEGATTNAVFLGVDSGQMAAIDAQVFLSQWQERDYDMQRIYQNKVTGDKLRWPFDFANYEEPIPAHGGKTMNELNATGEWEELPYQVAIDWSYNGLSHCHDNIDDIAIIGEAGMVSGTGWGDGCYEALLIERNNVITDFGITFIEEADAEDDDYDDDEEDEESEE